MVQLLAGTWGAFPCVTPFLRTITHCRKLLAERNAILSREVAEVECCRSVIAAARACGDDRHPRGLAATRRRRAVRTNKRCPPLRPGDRRP